MECGGKQAGLFVGAYLLALFLASLLAFVRCDCDVFILFVTKVIII